MRKTQLIIYSCALIVAGLFALTIFEPETQYECTDAVIVDKQLFPSSATIIVDTGASIENVNANREIYYRQRIGNAINVCKTSKKYSHLPVGWTIKK